MHNSAQQQADQWLPGDGGGDKEVWEGEII